MTEVLPPPSQPVLRDDNQFSEPWYRYFSQFNTFVTGISTVLGSSVTFPIAHWKNVTAYGAVGDGVTDNTTAFEAAIAAQSTYGEIVIGDRGNYNAVFLPTGEYVLTNFVNPLGRNVTYLMDSNVQIGSSLSDANFLGLGTIWRPHRLNRELYGIRDDCVGFTINCNNWQGGGNLDQTAEVSGYTNDAAASHGQFDTVSLYINNSHIEPLHRSSGTIAYTSNTVTIANPVNTDLLRYNMRIKTLHSTFFSGRLTTWNSSGDVLTVSGWYPKDTTTPTIPSSTAQVVVNVFDKTGGQNTNIYCSSLSYADSASGGPGLSIYEGAIWNEHTDWNESLDTSAGFISFSGGTKTCGSAYYATGRWAFGYRCDVFNIGSNSAQAAFIDDFSGCADSFVARRTTGGLLVSESTSDTFIRWDQTGTVADQTYIGVNPGGFGYFQASGDTQWDFYTSDILIFSVYDGLVIYDSSQALPTGGFKGQGTLNAKEVYNDNVALTCAPLEYLAEGRVDLAKWDAMMPGGGKHPTAHAFQSMLDAGFDPSDPEQYVAKLKADKALPGMPTQENYVHNQLGIGASYNNLVLAVDMLAMTVASIHDRLKVIEGST